MRQHVLLQVALPLKRTRAQIALEFPLLIRCNVLFGGNFDLPVAGEHYRLFHHNVQLNAVIVFVLLRRNGFLHFDRRSMALQVTLQLSIGHAQLRADEALEHRIVLMRPQAMLVERFGTAERL